MEELPEPKENLLAVLRRFLQNLGVRRAAAQKARTYSQEPSQSAFPHVSRHHSEELPSKKISEERLEEMRANSGKLKTFGKDYQDMASDSRKSQSTTRSLSEKFGMQSSISNSAEEQPLTLAESIRRKISESQKLTYDPQYAA